MKQRKGRMNHRSIVRAKGNLKLSYSGSSQTRPLAKSAPNKLSSLKEELPTRPLQTRPQPK